MDPNPRHDEILGAPLASAEQAMIAEYLRNHGYDPDQLDALPAEEQVRLRKEAAIYATAKLEEIEAEARFVHKFHEAGGTSHSAGD